MDNCVETLSQDIHDLIGECFKAISCELSFLPLPNAFEFFGFDFMGRMHIRCPFRLRCMFLVDNAWHCWLLEANAEPDFKQTGDRLKPMLQRMMEDAFQLIIDPLHPFNPVQPSVCQPSTVCALCLDAVGYAKPTNWQSMEVCLQQHTRLISRDTIYHSSLPHTFGIDPNTTTKLSAVISSQG